MQQDINKMKTKTTKKRLTKTERRIAVLKDVLQQIKLERYKATPGSYLELPANLRKLIRRTQENYLTTDIGYEETLGAKECLLKNTATCKVCAKGALFLSTVRRENKVKLLGLQDYSGDGSVVAELFGQKNLDRVEAAFENWYWKDNLGDYVSYKSIGTGPVNKRDNKITQFCGKYKDKTDRLVAIIKNMIKNKGIFHP